LKQKFAATFAIPNKGIEQIGPQERWRVRQPQVDQDQRRLPRRRPKFNEARGAPPRFSDVTDGGLYLFARPAPL
jgi:hypothetical protein